MHCEKEKSATPPRRKNRGFTLIEMLMVTAIIAVLVSVSIPMVGNSLERARIAADAANERAAVAAATMYYLNAVDEPIDTSPSNMYFYNADSGRLLTLIEFFPLYNAGAPGFDYGKCEYHKGGYISLAFSVTGEIDMDWAGENPLPHISSSDLTLPPI